MVFCTSKRGKLHFVQNVLSEQDFVNSLMSSLDNIATTPSLLCIELAELMVLSMRETSQHSLVLSDQFVKEGGEKVLADNLIAIGVSGTREQQVTQASTFSNFFRSPS